MYIINKASSRELIKPVVQKLKSQSNRNYKLNCTDIIKSVVLNSYSLLYKTVTCNSKQMVSSIVQRWYIMFIMTQSIVQKQAYLAGCAQLLTDETSPLGKIHPFSKIIVHFEPMIKFWDWEFCKMNYWLTFFFRKPSLSLGLLIIL